MFYFNQKRVKRIVVHCMVLVMALGVPGFPVFSKVVSDGTLGQSGEIGGPEYQITPQWGETAGSNLFHSFKEFNINKDETAVFSGPDQISRIIARITGQDPSVINGKLSSTIPQADLYLLNSSGIIFGKNASLNIDGSFHVSTADYLLMEDDERFYTLPFDNEVLSFAQPSAFGFLDHDVASIEFAGKGSVLELSDGETLSVIGGDITIEGTTLSSPEGQVNLVSVQSPGEVIQDDDKIEATSQTKGLISITENSLVDVSGEYAGSINILADQLNMDNSLISAKSTSPSFDDNLDFSFDEDSIDVAVKDIVLTNRSGITTSVSDEGDARGIWIHDCDTLFVGEKSYISSSTLGKGNGGFITINAKELTLDDGSFISSSSSASGDSGNAGEIIVKEAESINISGNSNITTSSHGQGGAGYISLNTQNLYLSDHSSITSSNVGENSTEQWSDWDFSDDDEYESGSFPGYIQVVAGNRIDLSDSSTINTSTSGKGVAGEISLKSNELSLTGNSSISSESSLKADGGDAGIITLNVDGKIELKDSRISTEAVDAGNGMIEIKGGGLLHMYSSTISSSVKDGNNSGGDVTITQRTVALNRSNITANAHEGEGGSIYINSDYFIQSQDSNVQASSNLGIDGFVEIDAPEVDFYKDLAAIEADLMDADQWVRTPCSARSGKDVSHFFIKGRDGVANDPEDWQPSPLLLLTRDTN